MKLIVCFFILIFSPCGLLTAGDRQARVVKYSDKDIVELRC